MDRYSHNHAGGTGSSYKGKAPLYSSQNSEPLVQEEYWCNECATLVQNSWDCLEMGHTLPRLGYNPHVPLDYQVADLDTHMLSVEQSSGSSGITGSWDPSSGSILSHTSGDQPTALQEYSASTSWFDSSAEPPSYPSFPPEQQQNATEATAHRMEAIQNPTADLPLTLDQVADIQYWLNKWEVRGYPPTELETCSLANLVSVDQDLLSNLVNAHLHPVRPRPTPQALPEIVLQPGEPTTLQQHVSSAEQDVARYAEQRNGGSCSNHKSMRVPRNRQFRCPTEGCHYSSDQEKDLVRHLLTKWPQEFWHCILCRQQRRRPFICHRRNKLVDHFESGAHNLMRGARCGELCKASSVEYSAAFPSTCSFANDSGPCCATFTSWAAYIKHILAHGRSPIPYGPWQLRNQAQRRFDDDEDESSAGPSKGAYSGVAPTFKRGSYAATSKNGSASSPQTSASNGNRTVQKRAQNPQLPIIRNLPLRGPKLLLDVVEAHLVAKLEDVKYLALDYSLVPKSRSTRKNDVGRTQRQGLPPEELKAIQNILPEAFRLTRRMGYRYLWIDTICAGSLSQTEALAMFNRATLIIVFLAHSGSPNDIWHFACHSHNVSTVLSWAHSTSAGPTFAHIQNLGHGAFGIVDEVTLSSGQETFARKILTTRREGKEDLKHVFREIEMLQKLRHPSIPSFVASYVQRHSLNVLTQPVAQCDLRMFLNNPDLWATKRPHLSRWYYSLASALEHIHTSGYRHKDIKPANILIHGEDVYIADFGTSINCDPESSGAGTFTPKYCAPEVLSRRQSGGAADVFSLGCVYLEMMTVQGNRSLRSLKKHIKKSSGRGPRASGIYHEVAGSLLSWIDRLQACTSSRYSSAILNICRRMLNPDPGMRPTAGEICQSLSPLIAYRLPPQPSFDLRNFMTLPTPSNISMRSWDSNAVRASQLWKSLYHVCSALRFLAQPQAELAHFDKKPENILVVRGSASERRQLLLTDFGLPRFQVSSLRNHTEGRVKERSLLKSSVTLVQSLEVVRRNDSSNANSLTIRKALQQHKTCVGYKSWSPGQFFESWEQTVQVTQLEWKSFSTEVLFERQHFSSCSFLSLFGFEDVAAALLCRGESLTALLFAARTQNALLSKSESTSVKPASPSRKVLASPTMALTLRSYRSTVEETRPLKSERYTGYVQGVSSIQQTAIKSHRAIQLGEERAYWSSTMDPIAQSSSPLGKQQHHSLHRRSVTYCQDQILASSFAASDDERLQDRDFSSGNPDLDSRIPYEYFAALVYRTEELSEQRQPLYAHNRLLSSQVGYQQSHALVNAADGSAEDRGLAARWPQCPSGQREKIGSERVAPDNWFDHPNSQTFDGGKALNTCYHMPDHTDSFSYKNPKTRTVEEPWGALDIDLSFFDKVPQSDVALAKARAASPKPPTTRPCPAISRPSKSSWSDHYDRPQNIYHDGGASVNKQRHLQKGVHPSSSFNQSPRGFAEHEFRLDTEKSTKVKAKLGTFQQRAYLRRQSRLKSQIFRDDKRKLVE